LSEIQRAITKAKFYGRWTMLVQA